MARYTLNNPQLIALEVDDQGAIRTGLTADAAPARLTHDLVSLPAANTVYRITIPDWARGVGLSEASAGITYAINEDPTVRASATALGASAYTLAGVGNRVGQNERVVRLLAAGTNRQLRLATNTAGATVRVEFFGA